MICPLCWPRQTFKPLDVSWWALLVDHLGGFHSPPLPDGTRVRLTCGPRCQHRDHAGVWRTAWTPRRLSDPDAPDDYHLTREGDGETTYARRDAIEPLQ